MSHLLGVSTVCSLPIDVFIVAKQHCFKITNDIFDAFDSRQSTLLVEQEQSTAFDCVDHETLLSLRKVSSG